MKKAKVRVTGNYVSRTSFKNPIDMILNLPIGFTHTDIENKIVSTYHPEGYSIGKVEVLCVYDED